MNEMMEALTFFKQQSTEEIVNHKYKISWNSTE